MHLHIYYYIRAHRGLSCDVCQLASQRNYIHTCLGELFARAQKRRIESSPSGKYLWTVSTAKTLSFAVTRPPYISLHFHLIVCLVPLLAVQWATWCNAKKENFLAQVKWLPMISQHHVTDSLTDRQTNVRLV